MARSFLDDNGLRYLWSEFKNMFAKKTDLSAYALKSEISSALRYKGTVSTYSDLPSSDQSVGDLWNVETADATHGIKAGDNVVWNGTAWDVQGGTIDLTGYAKTSDLDGKVDKVSGKDLSTNDFTNALKTKLEGIATGATNVTVDSSLSSTSANPVRNSAVTSALGGKVDKADGKDLSSNDFTDTLKSKLEGIESGAQANAVTSVAGKTGAVVLAKGDVGLGNVDNTADEDKSVASAAALTTPRSIEGVKFDGSANVSHRATCTTAAATAAKAATISPSTTNFALVEGARVLVRFTNAISVKNASLNVNGSGAKPIYYNGAALGSGLTDAGGTYEFVYNGSQWELVGDLDTAGGISAMSQAEATTGTATTGRSISAKVLNDTIVEKIGTEIVAITNAEIDEIVAS